MDAIVSHIWQSTIVAAAAAMLAWMLRRNSAAVRYWIWFAAAMKFLVPFAALAAIPNQIPLPHAPRPAGEALEAATVMFRSAALPAVPAATFNMLVAVWAIGACVVCARFMWQWRALRAHARESPEIAGGVVHDALRRVERSEGINTAIAIVASNRSAEPGIIGVHKPVLLWPQHLTAQLSAAHLDSILAHEVWHVARRDNLLAIMQMVVSAVFWFHPLVWWIGARLIDERERACDERVLARGRQPSAYAESILTTCRLCLASPTLSVSGVTGGDLKRRIARIMRNEPAQPLDVRRKTVLLAAALVLVLLPTAAGISACLPQRVATAATPRIVMPRLIRESKPHYTARAMNEKIQGEVLMECVVKRDGTVADTRIVKSLHPDLDQAALAAAKDWIFEPGTRDGKTVSVQVTIAMAFTLK